MLLQDPPTPTHNRDQCRLHGCSIRLRIEPSTINSTFNSVPIVASGLGLHLYDIADLRPMTLRRFRSSWLSNAIISSVRPSARYSCDGSPLRFTNGNTATIIVVSQPR